ncbi:MAG: hypothetical protein ACWA40_06480 [Planktomarina sp.]
MRVLCALLLLFAGQAHALSCVPNSAQSMYQRAAKAEEAYLPVLGRFSIPEGTVQWTDGGGSGQHDGHSFQAQFVGKALTQYGFKADFDQTVTVHVSCLSIWCGGVGDWESLALLQQSDDGYSLSAGPCSGWIMPVSRIRVDDFVTCHKGGACEDPFKLR